MHTPCACAPAADRPLATLRGTDLQNGPGAPSVDRELEERATSGLRLRELLQGRQCRGCAEAKHGMAASGLDVFEALGAETSHQSGTIGSLIDTFPGPASGLNPGSQIRPWPA